MNSNPSGIERLITKRNVIIGWISLLSGTALLFAAITQGFSKPFEIARNFASIPFLLLAFFIMLRVSLIYLKKLKR